MGGINRFACFDSVNVPAPLPDNMGFRRSTYRRGYRRRHRGYKRRGSYKRIQRVARRVVQNSKIRKVNDLYYNNVSLTTTGGVTGFITQIQRQATNAGSFGEEASRVSNVIAPKSITLDLKLIGSQTSAISLASADIYNTIRVIVVRYNGPQIASNVGTIAAIQAQYLQGSTGARTDDMKQPRNEDFTTLFDRRYVLKQYFSGAAAAGAALSSTPEVKWCRHVIKGKSLRRIYFQGDSSSADVRNGIGVYIFSDSAAPPNPSISGTIRMWYTDT